MRWSQHKLSVPKCRSFESGLQKIVKVISPGPLGVSYKLFVPASAKLLQQTPLTTDLLQASAEACDAQRQARAARAVQDAIQRWQAGNAQRGVQQSGPRKP